MIDLTNIDIALALDKIRPRAAWRMSDSYENLKATWEDKVQKLPTEQEIAEAWVSIQKERAFAALDAEYQPQFRELQLAWAAASMDGNTTLATAIKTDRTALKTEYATKREAIESGN